MTKPTRLVSLIVGRPLIGVPPRGPTRPSETAGAWGSLMAGATGAGPQISYRRDASPPPSHGFGGGGPYPPRRLACRALSTRTKAAARWHMQTFGCGHLSRPRRELAGSAGGRSRSSALQPAPFPRTARQLPPVHKLVTAQGPFVHPIIKQPPGRMAWGDAQCDQLRHAHRPTTSATRPKVSPHHRGLRHGVVRGVRIMLQADNRRLVGPVRTPLGTESDGYSGDTAAGFLA